jgi:tRNA-splicing ligase RtcB (3'-phosphate/5'-hydroxy nucleic acid ligase)
MKTLTGKYNSANVMIDEIDEETSKQISSFLNHPAFARTYIAIMPDCHAGAGAVIGFTSRFNDYVIPNIVGVDIGCGVLGINLGRTVFASDQDFERLDRFIKANIPSGFNIRSISEKMVNNLRPEETVDDDLLSSVLEVITETGQDRSRVIGSIGTLGGGNHFIEIDHNVSTGEDWLLIHSGSRNFGLRVAGHYQDKAKDLLKKMFINENIYKGLEYLPLDLGGKEYLEAMKVAQQYASLNRRVMAKLIVGWILRDDCYDTLPSIETIHNYISFEDNIIRKGAVSAREGEHLVIPFNMRDGVMVCRGKGCKKWNYSAPHGAGRILSRHKAKDTIKLEDFQNTMKGIYTTTADDTTIDESPMAYKHKDIIIEAVAETVDIEFFMKPVYNFKAGGE